MVMALLPSMRAIVSASLKVERTVARSAHAHDGVVAGDDRKVGDILRRLDQRRHLDRQCSPSEPSIAPAATRLLEAPMPWIIWSSRSP